MYKCFNKIFKKKKEINTIRNVAVESLYHIIEDYSNWYAEHGLYLPPDYATDPSKWTTELQKMKRAFQLLYEEIYEEGELFEAKTKWKEYGQEDIEKIKELEKEIIEGMTLFGSQLLYLTDNITDELT